MTTTTPTPTTDPTIPASPQHDALMQKLADLQSCLLAQDPLMPKHLKEIHSLLIQHEELVHLLSDEQIGEIMSRQQMITNTTLVAAVTAKGAKTSASKKASQLTLDSL